MVKILLFCTFIFSLSCTAKDHGTDKKYLHLQKGKASASIPNELLVKFQTGASQEEAHKVIASCNGTIIKHLEGINVFHIRVTSSATEGMACFQKNSSVKYAEPNRVVKIYK